MSFESRFADYLLGDDGISALVFDRVYPTRLPEKTTLPAITWHRVSANRQYTFDTFDDTDPWVQARVQLNCWGRDALEAMDVGTAVLAALSGFEGDMGGDLIGSSFAVDEFDIYDAPTKYHRRILDFMISYEDEQAAS